jgi:orotidine-5'-phosphate decarboxylase
MVSNFGHRLANAVNTVGVPLALGLDPHLNRFPKSFQDRWLRKTGLQRRSIAAEAIVDFNSQAIDAAKGRVAAIKPQFAFYEQLGAAGFEALEETCRQARESGLLIIGDAKRGDISSTAAAYATAILSPDGPFYCDSVTLNPWMGMDTIEPFLPYCRDCGSGVFVLLRTTNPGAKLLQHHGTPTAAHALADAMSEWNNEWGDWSPIGAVVGAMTPTDAREMRTKLPSSWFLVPGVGAQGGSIQNALAGSRPDSMGSLVVCSRALLYPNQDSEEYENAPGHFIKSQIEKMRERFID